METPSGKPLVNAMRVLTVESTIEYEKSTIVCSMPLKGARAEQERAWHEWSAAKSKYVQSRRTRISVSNYSGHHEVRLAEIGQIVAGVCTLVVLITGMALSLNGVLVILALLPVWLVSYTFYWICTEIYYAGDNRAERKAARELTQLETEFVRLRPEPPPFSLNAEELLQQARRNCSGVRELLGN